MSTPNDPWALRCRQALRTALLTLIDQRLFDQITIRDITNAAGVSYPVFFRRYATKDDLLEDVAAEEVRALPPQSPDLNPIEMAFSKLKAHLRKAKARPIEALRQAAGSICSLYSTYECWNYLKEAGYVAD
jgi:AcrR family transcriptional regulator